MHFYGLLLERGAGHICKFDNECSVDYHRVDCSFDIGFWSSKDLQQPVRIRDGCLQNAQHVEEARFRAKYNLKQMGAHRVLDEIKQRFRSRPEETVLMLVYPYAVFPLVREIIREFYRECLAVGGIEFQVAGWLGQFFSGKVTLSKTEYRCVAGDEAIELRASVDSSQDLLDIRLRSCQVKDTCVSGPATAVGLQQIEFQLEDFALGAAVFACIAHAGEAVRFPDVGEIRRIRVNRFCPWNLGIVGKGRDGLYWRLLFPVGTPLDTATVDVLFEGSPPQSINLACPQSVRSPQPRWLMASQFEEYDLRWWGEIQPKLRGITDQQVNTLRLTMCLPPNPFDDSRWIESSLWTVDGVTPV